MLKLSLHFCHMRASMARLHRNLPRLVVLDHEESRNPSTSHGIRDDLRNRIAALDLSGVRVDRLVWL
jgi:hypothetical protein